MLRMGFRKLKMIHLGMTLYMVLSPIAHIFDMPCWASVESAKIEAEEHDPEDVGPAIGHAAQVRIEFIKGFNSRIAMEGDTVVGKLMEDMKLLDGCTLAPKGSRIYGRVELVNRSKSITKSATNKKDRWNRRASVVLRFDKVVTPQKAKLEITGTAAPQYNIFSNGETVRMVLVGGEGELLKTQDTELSGLPEFGLVVPHDWVKLRGRYQIEVRPGDELLVDVDLGRHNEVQAELVGGKESKTH
jgi:hypothetical protein